MQAEHLRDRLDCLLHGVACEETDSKSQEVSVSIPLCTKFTKRDKKTLLVTS